MDDDDLITHLAVGNLDDPESDRSSHGCLYLLAAIVFFGLLAILI